MARRGCASGRRKQLRRLVKALHEHKEFDPGVFNQANPTPPPPPTPGYQGYAPPKLEKQIAKVVPAPTSRSKTPARPSASDVAPVRIRTRPLPVSAQIKKRGMITTGPTKPTIIDIVITRFNVERRGSRILFKGRIPPILHKKGTVPSGLIVTTGDSGGIPEIPV